MTAKIELDRIELALRDNSLSDILEFNKLTEADVLLFLALGNHVSLPELLPL